MRRRTDRGSETGTAGEGESGEVVRGSEMMTAGEGESGGWI
jgi:hypothetical protein